MGLLLGSWHPTSLSLILAMQGSLSLVGYFLLITVFLIVFVLPFLSSLVVFVVFVFGMTKRYAEPASISVELFLLAVPAVIAPKLVSWVGVGITQHLNGSVVSI